MEKIEIKVLENNKTVKWTHLKENQVRELERFIKFLENGGTCWLKLEK